MRQRRRFVNDLEDHLFYAQKQSLKDTDPTKIDFSDVIENSSLQMLKLEEIEQAKAQGQGTTSKGPGLRAAQAAQDPDKQAQRPQRQPFGTT